MAETKIVNQFSFLVQSKGHATSPVPPPPRVRTGSVFLPTLIDPRAVSNNARLQYMNGVAVPNSVVRAQPRKTEQEDYEARRRDTAAELERILRQFMPHEEDTEDSNLLVRIQKELERRRLVNKTVQDKDEEYDEQKEQRRIWRRTSRLEPLACSRRSTCESIHRSIQQSEQIQKLITDDFLENPVADKEEEKYTEITTLSPPKPRSQKSSHKTPSAKAKLAAKSPPQNATRRSSPAKPLTGAQFEAKKNRGLNSNQKPNNQPWTTYVQPKVTKSNDSLEEPIAEILSSKKNHREVQASSISRILDGGSLFIKTTPLNSQDKLMLRQGAIEDKDTLSYAGKRSIDKSNQGMSEQLNRTLGKAFHHESNSSTSAVESGRKHSKKLTPLAEMQKTN